VAVLAGTCAFAAAVLGPGWHRVAVLSLYVMLGALYVVTPGKFHRKEAACLTYLVGATAVFSAATFIFPGSGLLLMILVAQCYMLLPLRLGLVASTAFVALNAASELAWAGTTTTALVVVCAEALSVLVAFLFGSYITRIVAQSAQRAELIDELEHTRAAAADLARVSGALEERERLDREVHDALAQGFTSVVMVVQAARSALERGRPQDGGSGA
jgi:signal transduction histidine kinase